MKSERGQVVVLTAVMLAALLGLGAMVLDVGAWFRTKRQVQATADAAALAGAQELHLDDGQAQALAVQYGASNGGGVAAGDVTFESQWTAGRHDRRPRPQDAPELLLEDLRGRRPEHRRHREGPLRGAVARRGTSRRSASTAHIRLLSGAQCPCFGQSTTLDLQKVGPGAFRLLNLDNSHGGTSPGILADWMLHGYDDYMGLGWYFSDPGAKFNATAMQNALQQIVGHEVLFPVYDQTQAQGANFQYRVIGWVAFHMTGYSGHGNTGDAHRLLHQHHVGRHPGAAALRGLRRPHHPTRRVRYRR